MRSAILGGAAQVFASRGVAQSSVEDILVASGISRRTFYRRFRSREEVLAALFDVASALFVRAFHDAAAREREPSAKLARCVDTVLDFSQNSGPLMRVLLGESQRLDSPLAARRAAAFAELVELLSREAAAFVGRPVEPLLLHGLLAGLESMATAVLGAGPPSPAVLGNARAAMQRLVAATLAGEGALVPPLPGPTPA